MITAFSPTSLFSVTLSFIRFCLGLGKKHRKLLVGRVVDRGIIAELPPEAPFHICDERGERHRGIYVIGLLLWNRGTEAILESDVLPAAPIRITIGDDAEVAYAGAIPADEQTVCRASRRDERTIDVVFDCINPKEYISLAIFMTGNPRTDVRVSGRIAGQEIAIDHTAEEAKAAIADRIFSFVGLGIAVNTVLGTPVSGWIMYKHFGLAAFYQPSDAIPKYLTASFVGGLMVLVLYLFAQTTKWLERRNYPEDYPLRSDLEPPLSENIKGLAVTTFKGKKQRVSASLFDWGSPIIMPAKKVRRRTRDDWFLP